MESEGYSYTYSPTPQGPPIHQTPESSSQVARKAPSLRGGIAGHGHEVMETRPRPTLTSRLVVYACRLT